MAAFNPSILMQKSCQVFAGLLVALSVISCSDNDPANSASEWSSPQILASGNVSVPSVAVGAEGKLYAAWSDYDSSAPFSVAQFLPGTGWQTAEPIGELISDALEFEYKIAANAAGDIVNVWVRYDAEAGVSTVLSNRYVPGSGWQGAVSLDAENSATSPTVVIDEEGNAVVAWRTPFALVTSHGARDGTFSSPVAHSSGVQEFKLAMDSTGAAVIVYSHTKGANILVTSSARSTSFGNWSDAEDISIARFASNIACSPPCPLGNLELDVATNRTGDIAVTWEAFDEDVHVRSVWVNTFHQEGGWGLPEVVAEVNFWSFHSPVIMIDDESNLTVLWRDTEPYLDAALDLWMRRYSPLSGWQPSTKQEQFTDALVYSESPITPNGSGGFFMSWFDRGAHVAEWNPSTGWSDIYNLNRTSENTYAESQVVVDEDGKATLIWFERDSNENDSTFTIRASQRQ